MWPSVTSFKRRLALLLALVLLPVVQAATSITLDEALALAFPDCEVERKTLYLTDDQRQRAAELAVVDSVSGLIHTYRATKEAALVGTAYLDTHTVRTLPETLLVVVDTTGAVSRVEVLSFREPPDYLPRAGWYDQFKGKQLDQNLAPNRGIHGITGATLTTRATTAAVRRVLAIDQILREGVTP
jgi:Na+-translocating ferredoxin:NAD+ oxidoreductase RnfG subunit